MADKPPLTLPEAAKALGVPAQVLRNRMNALAPNEPRLSNGDRIVNDEMFKRLSDHLQEKPYKPQK